MEIIAIESKAFATLVEKIEGIAAYVEASGTKEREQWPVADKKGTRKAGLWMTGKEVCEQLEISPVLCSVTARTVSSLTLSAGGRYVTAVRTWNSSMSVGYGKRLTSWWTE